MVSFNPTTLTETIQRILLCDAALSFDNDEQLMHPHTHHIVAPGFVDRPRRSDCTAGQMDGEAGWWTTSGNIGLPPLARAMGVGRQQQQLNGVTDNVVVITMQRMGERLDRLEDIMKLCQLSITAYLCRDKSSSTRTI